MCKKLSFPFSLLLLLLGFSFPLCLRGQKGIPPRNLWCVAKNNAADDALQQAINWACGPGGADCGPIQPGGPCYDASDVERTASWAFNDYFLKHGLTDDACYFSNSAALTSLNPSHGDCKFPSSLSVNNGSSSGSSTTIQMGPDTADFSGCSGLTSTFLWPLLTSYLLVVFTQAVQSTLAS